MNLDGEPSNSDEYFVTAHQIFECCGIESDSTLRVDSLMDKFTPFVKTNKFFIRVGEQNLHYVTHHAPISHWSCTVCETGPHYPAEFSFLKSLLDPEECNPEINVTKLANALHQYSESHKSKMDLDESFNLRCGQAPQDSDSGISTDGLQLLEDLQCELKEKDRMAQQLRSQLEYTDRQHEETTAALTAERDSLRRHLNMLREENASLSTMRRDYDEACERLCASGLALDEAKRELEGFKRRARVSAEQVATLEADKLSLQDLLAKSKDECHRINEMYAARQSALLGESETLAAQRAELAARLRDQDEFMKQLLKEKLLLEMELKDTLNKSNQTQQRLDRSVDISYTEDQMLTALDSLNADSRFSSENRILDDDSFMNALKEDQGRITNMSLFDEIRMSFNMSRMNVTEFNTAHCGKCSLDNSIVTSATQTEDFECYADENKNRNSLEFKNVFTTETQTQAVEVGLVKVTTGIQTDDIEIQSYRDECKGESRSTASNDTQTENESCYDKTTVAKTVMIDFGTQTDLDVLCNVVFKNTLGIQTDDTNEIELYSGGDNALNSLNNRCVRKLDFDTSFQDKPYKSEDNIQFLDAKDYIDAATQTVGEFIRKRPKFVKRAQKLFKLKQDAKHIDKYRTVETQTDEKEPCVNNNNVHSIKCRECNRSYNDNKIEKENNYSNMVVKEMEAKLNECEHNLDYLEKLVGQGKEKNEKQQAMVEYLRSKIAILESSCEVQREAINMIDTDKCCVQSQTEFEAISVSTQADVPCACSKPSPRGLRRFLWEPLKCLFQIFAVVCFVAALSLLYGVCQRGRVRCDREPTATPWRWFDAQDLMDLLLRIEYTAEVPM